MMNFFRILKLLIILLAAAFILNIIVMRLFFNINILRPPVLLLDILRNGPEDKDGKHTGISGKRTNYSKEGSEKMNREAGGEAAGAADAANATDAAEATDEKGEAYGVKSGVGRERMAGEEAEVKNTDKHSGGMFLGPEEVKFFGQLKLKDKLLAMTLLSKIGTNETDNIFEMAIDGVTYEEYEEIKLKLEKKLSKSEIESLTDIIERNKMLYVKID